MKEGKRCPRPHEKADPKPAEQGLITPIHPDEQSDSPSGHNTKKSKNNSSNHKKSPSRSRKDDTATRGAVKRRDQLTKEEGGARQLQEEEGATAGEAEEKTSIRTWLKAR